MSLRAGAVGSRVEKRKFRRMVLLESASDGVMRLELSNVHICQSIDGSHFDLYAEGTS